MNFVKKTIEKSNFRKFDINTFKMKDTRVLIIDNDDICNEVISKMLKEVEAEANIVKNAQEALSKFGEKEYDIIFVADIFNNEKAGMEFLSKMKNVLVVGMDANLSNEFRNLLNKYGVELFLLKPVKFEQLAVIFRNELQNKIIAK